MKKDRIKRHIKRGNLGVVYNKKNSSNNKCLAQQLTYRPVLFTLYHKSVLTAVVYSMMKVMLLQAEVDT